MSAAVACVEALAPVLVRRQDAAITRDPHLYSAAVVEVVAAGALMVRDHELDPATAGKIAATVRSELEDGLVFDDERVADIDSSYR